MTEDNEREQIIKRLVDALVVADCVSDPAELGDTEEEFWRFMVGKAVMPVIDELQGCTAPVKPEPPKREPCPEGWHYIGQHLTHCAECGLPPWEHAGRAVLPKDAGPFGGHDWVLKPWKPGEADRFRDRVLGDQPTEVES